MQSVDDHWMALAIEQAKLAKAAGEVPVGAVMVKNETLITAAGNTKESRKDPLGHAEIQVIKKSAEILDAWRLLDCTLYVTLEPCIMCSGALIQSRVKRLVIGTLDPKGGGVQSLYQLLQDQRLNHQIEVTHGVRQEECSNLLKEFFRNRRNQNKE